MEFPLFQFVAIVSLFLLLGVYICWKAPPEPSLFLSEQSQLSQPFLTLQMPQSINHLCGLLLILLQYICVSLVLGIPEENKAFQVWPHQSLVEAKDHLLGPAGNAMSYCSPGKSRILSNQGSNSWPSWLKGHISGLHSAWYSPGSQVFSRSLNNKNVSYTIMNGSYAIWSLSFK